MSERSSPLLVAGAMIIGTLGLIAIFADVLAPYDPQDPRAGLPLEQPSASHLLGTNDSGQDILSQLIAGPALPTVAGSVSSSRSVPTPCSGRR